MQHLTVVSPPGRTVTVGKKSELIFSYACKRPPGRGASGNGCTASLRLLSLCPNHESAVQIMSMRTPSPSHLRDFNSAPPLPRP